VGNVHFEKAVNALNDPVIRCERCRKLMPDEREPIGLAEDPDFKKIRLFQICIRCASEHYPPGYWVMIRKRKWELIEYQRAINSGTVEEYWRKRGRDV